MRNLHLPPLSSDIVVAPAHALAPIPPWGGHRIHASPVAHGWRWVHLLRAVSGWQVIASGVLADGQQPTAAKACYEILRRYAGEDGEGCDRLPLDRFTQTGSSRIACVLRAEGPATYCDQQGERQAVFELDAPGHAEQHCIDCDAAYRAAHYGRMALPQ